MNTERVIIKGKPTSTDYENLQREVMWDEALFKTNLAGIDNNSIVELCKNFRGKTSGQSKSNRGGWQLDLERWDNEAVAELFDRIEAVCTQLFAERFGIPRETRINRAWLNVNEKHHYNSAHTHPGAVFSGVYYVKADGLEEQGVLSFIRGDQVPIMTVPESAGSHNADPIWRAYNKQVMNTGDLFLFPPWLLHEVHRNETDSERIVIAFNVQFHNHLNQSVQEGFDGPWRVEVPIP